MKSYSVLLLLVVVLFVGKMSATDIEAALDEPSFMKRSFRKLCSKCPSCPALCNSVIAKRESTKNTDFTYSSFISKQAATKCYLDTIFSLMPAEDQDIIIDTFIQLL
nr:uncharacterized protein LOC129260595 [Lytechinus pictus]